MKRLKKILGSYFSSSTIEKRKSKLNPYLEVVYSNGKLKMNSRTINYSDDGGHTIFQKAFSKFNIEKRKIEKVLVLGFGTGSVVSILQENYKLNCQITGVEADSVVIDLAKKHFQLDAIKNLTLHCADAYDFVLACSDTFDLIVMDAFIDKYVPGKFHGEIFVNSLVNLLKGNGILFFNYISIDDRTENGLQKIFQILKKLPGSAVRYAVSVLGIGNIVLIYEKKS